MPVTTDQDREKTRRRGRPWLWVCLCLLALLLLLPVVPLVHPISLQAGRHVVVVGTERLPASMPMVAMPRFHSVDEPPQTAGTAHTTTSLSGKQYRITGDAHARVIFFRRGAYYVAWFEGRRGQ
jgi:hypothetical protein